MRAGQLSSAPDMPRPLREPVLRLEPSEGERLALLEAISPAFHRLLVVACESGLSRGDLLALDWSSVSLSEGLLRVARLKTGVESVIPLSAACRAALGPQGTGLVFRTARGRGIGVSALNRAWRAAKAAAGIERRLRWHDLRHGFASRCASGGVSLLVLKAALGHSSLRTVERYARPDLSAMEAVRRALDPRDDLEKPQ